MKLVSISSIKSTTKSALQKIKLRESHHSQDETLTYLNNLYKQVRRLGGIEKIIEACNAKVI